MAMDDVRQGGQGSVEFDDSAAAGAVENRISIVRSLVEDLNSSDESRYAHDVTVDGKIWRIVVERQP